jgi:hypothetical protein
MKSLFTTILGAAVGFIFSFIFSIFGLTSIGWILIAAFAVVGFGIGTLTIPDSKIVGNLRKAGGEQVAGILLRTITFSRKKKIYVYRNGGNK